MLAVRKSALVLNSKPESHTLASDFFRQNERGASPFPTNGVSLFYSLTSPTLSSARDDVTVERLRQLR